MPRLTAIRKQALDEMMKQAIFEATVAVLGEHGLEGLTMDRVAAAAGVAKGSLYRYFRGKQDLLEFAYAKLVDPVVGELDTIVASAQPALEKLMWQLRAMLDRIAQNAQVHKLFFEDEAVLGLLRSSERRTLEIACQRLAEIFRQGIAEGTFHPADPRMLASMYLGLTRSVIDNHPDLREGDQREGVYCLIMGVFLNGIATKNCAIC